MTESDDRWSEYMAKGMPEISTLQSHSAKGQSKCTNQTIQERFQEDWRMRRPVLAAILDGTLVPYYPVDPWWSDTSYYSLLLQFRNKALDILRSV